MKLDQLLDSLTDAERNFIAGLDYGNDSERHREQLDVVIQNKGKVDFGSQLWFPYEVIELGRTLQAGHEREFAVCWAIVLKNVAEGADRMNDADQLFSKLAEVDSLPEELRQLVHFHLDIAITES